MAGAAELCVPLEVNLSVGSQLGRRQGLTKEERMIGEVKMDRRGSGPIGS